MKKYSLIVLVLVFVYLVSFTSQVSAITIGNKNGSAFSSDSSSGGTAVWNDTASAKISDDNYATTVLNITNSSTNYIKVTGFNFNVPAGATIDGIKVRIKRKHQCGTCVPINSAVIMDKVVSLVKSGSVVGENRARTQEWESNSPNDVRTYGVGTTDLWGTSWDVADINNPNFGAVMSAELFSGDNVSLGVDWFSVMVYYSLPGNPILSEVVAIPANTNDVTPDFTFSTNSAGTLQFTGNCSSATTSVLNSSSNTIALNEFDEGLYSHCTMILTDGSMKKSNTLAIPAFRVDTTPPVITLTGASTIDLFVGDTYTELGATATDIYIIDQENVPNAVTVDITGTVDTSHAGTYTVTYNATDPANNNATPVTRTVNVKVKESGGGGGGGGGSVPLYILEQMNKRNLEQNQNEELEKSGAVLGAERFIFTLFLQFDSHRVPANINEIIELQKRLKSEGFYNGPIDGKFKILTKNAVKDYQKANPPLVVDGIVGRFTREALNKEFSKI